MIRERLIVKGEVPTNRGSTEVLAIQTPTRYLRSPDIKVTLFSKITIIFTVRPGLWEGVWNEVRQVDYLVLVPGLEGLEVLGISTFIR